MLRQHPAFAALLAVLAAFYFWLTWYEGLGGTRGDGLIYLYTARHYAPYWPDDPTAAIWASVTQFPPVYSLLLAATGGTLDLRLAHGATTLCLLAAFAGFYAWLLALGMARSRAVAATAVFALLPGTFMQSLFLHPEGLYVCLAFVALACLAAGEMQRRARWFWLASVAVALAILTRTVGITLLPALGIALLRHRPPRWAPMAAVAVVPGLLWSLAHKIGWSYSDTLTDMYLGLPLDAIARQVGASAFAAGHGVLDNLGRGPRVFAVALCALAAGVALWRFARGRPDAWYALAYLAVLALWPYPQEAERLTWVLLPFLVGYVALIGDAVARRAPAVLGSARPVAAWLPAAALALTVLPEFGLLLGRATSALARDNPAYRHYPEWYEPQPRLAWTLTELRLRTAEALRRFGPQIPPGECAFSTMSFLAAGFHLQRDLRPPPPEATDEAGFDQGIRDSGCRYFIFSFELDRLRSVTRPYYPLERVRHRVEILDEHHGAPEAVGSGPVAALAVLRTD